jgi:hypothetical protein
LHGTSIIRQIVARASELDSPRESSDDAPGLQPPSGNCILSRGSPAVTATHRFTGARLALMLLAASGAALAAEADMVNERPPVSREQLEQHWGVDCARLRRELLAASAGSAHDASPGATPEDAPARIARWRAGLRLCAAIHNAPGNDTALPCPDYARAARSLGEDAAGRDAQQSADIGDALRCAP